MLHLGNENRFWGRNWLAWWGPKLDVAIGGSVYGRPTNQGTKLTLSSFSAVYKVAEYLALACF